MKKYADFRYHIKSKIDYVRWDIIRNNNWIDKVVLKVLHNWMFVIKLSDLNKIIHKTIRADEYFYLDLNCDMKAIKWRKGWTIKHNPEPIFLWIEHILFWQQELWWITIWKINFNS